MKVRVRLFARARDLVGADAVEVELANEPTVGSLRRQLGRQHPQLLPLLERSAVAVNEEFASEDVVLQPEAEVALLPPVSGGRP
jgi:molybdopterin converting factor subunit 1